MERCPWCEGDALYTEYHDKEWGVPVHDDKIHFEFLVLESAQAGLSWLTILKRRQNYKKAYEDFNVEKVASYDETKIEQLMNNPGIIRNRRKIEASISNAKRFIEIQKEFSSFDSYIWSFVDNKPIKNSWKAKDEVPANTELSDEISKDLKKRGFKFIGTTIMYSHLQTVGIVNDHIIGCFRYNQV